MFKASFLHFLVITVISQFYIIQVDAGIDWYEFFNSWIFGSNHKMGHVQHSRVLIKGEEAEKKFIDNEVHKVSKPKFIKAQIEHNTSEIDKWYEYHKSANFIMRYIAEWAMDTLWAQRERLYEELDLAREDVDLEPFCHYRYLNNDAETDNICRRVLQNKYFHDQGWFLNDDERDSFNHYKHCSRVSVSSIKMNEHNRYPKLSYYREARRCSAYLKKTQESSPIYFSVYLISHENYLLRKQFAYFVLLNKDTAEKPKSQMRRILRYLKFWEEKKVQVAAYIEE
ncbi:uncharacterized protein LOC135849450 [Planococcus citri]|uniref:uncharacterized protein LOC135849450 n=1 Tax=Planococcus citri TaxID=170843 RepID=UPI0031F7A85A